ncbi:hypothetical protein PanNE5_01210 [Pandoraea sp. NE5]|uniref:hypothetical protein n=1 Tax=unclassified Pandoraea TaxID=2624094 RepID=UPI00095D4F4A|nr:MULTISPECIES: hypothetical protein [unclassified Pandoraea]OJY24875.1 MAG: hypothetical protein BGP02_13885 [Pandoraea sp. 64-18]BDD90681.1 hypothetical protein PanNE5_01210 [Pandoraea sp. NE5]
MSPDMRDRFVILDFEAITDESATCLVTRRYEPLQGAALAFLETFWRVARELAASSDGPTRRIFSMVDAAGEAGRGAGSHVSARQTLTQYG